MNIVDRTGIPMAVAFIAVMLGLTLMMLGSPAQVVAQSELTPGAHITVVITDGDDTVSWSDPDGCTSDYNTYLAVTPPSNDAETSRTHIGSVVSGSTEATQAISYSGGWSSVAVELYCGTYDASSSQNVLIAETDLSLLGSRIRPVGSRIRPGTYSSTPLTALTISSVTLSPAFERGIYRYTAEVPSDVRQITLDPTVLTGYETDFVSNPGWGIVQVCGPWGDDCVYSYGDGETTGIDLSDADTEADGFQVNLTGGENRLGIGINKGSVGVGPGELYYLTVTVPNAPATGQPVITGIAKVGQTLTAVTSGISDADGLTNVAYSYQWLSSRDTEIDGATSSTYTPQASDAGKVIKVRVTFVDDAGNEESLTSEATGAVAANVVANGAPTITGTVEVGETLTADTSGIKDEDGLDNVTFTFHWIRSDGTTDWDIEGATGATYTVTAIDVGKAIKLRVSFTDDAGNGESLTSSATVAVPIEVTFTFTIEGTTVTCDSYYKECDDTSSIEQGTSPDIEVETEIARSVSSHLYKFNFHIYQMQDNIGHEKTVEANDLCLGSGLAESVSIEITPDDGTGPFTYSDEGTIFELCPEGTYQLYVPWYRYDYSNQEYEYAGTFRRYFSITSSDEEDTSIEKVRYIRPLHSDQPVSHNDVQIEVTKESGSLNRELATFSLSIGGLVPDSNLETTDYVVTVWVVNTYGSAALWCHVGDVGYSYLLKTVLGDGGWAMKAHLRGACITHWYPEILRVELLNGSQEYIAGKDVALRPEPNTPATGAPTIGGTLQVGQTLTADTSGITDADGLDNVTYTYQWLSSQDVEIAGATSSTYTLVSTDEGKIIKVRVSFTDDEGNEESLTSAATTEVGPQPNSPANSEPSISGTAQVGQTLTADTSGISDADGLDNVAYTYQWLSSRDTELTGGTSSTYTLVEADEGKTIKVRVSFTDDRGNQETLTSSATGAVVAAQSSLTASSHSVPTSHEGSSVFTFELRFSEEFGISYKTLRDHAFMVTGGEVNKARRLERGKNLRWEISVTPDGNGNVTVVLPVTTDCSAQGAICTADGRKLSNRLEITVNGPVAARPNSAASGAPTISGTARVGETLTASTSGISDADGLTNATFTYQWLSSGDTEVAGATGSTYTLTDSEEGKTINVRVSFTDDRGNQETLTSAATGAVAARPNSTASGAPAISGTAQVGETLTASTSGISDADGLTNATFTYQWLSSRDTEIAGATGSTYTLTDSEEGKTIKVRVSFTDDRGNQETLTSAATGAVAAAPTPLTASTHHVPESHDGQNAFTFELRFSEEFELSYVKLRDHAFTVTGGTVTKSRRLDRPSNIRWEITVVPSPNAAVTIELPVTADCEAQGAICTEDGRKLSNSLDFTVSGPN